MIKNINWKRIAAYTIMVVVCIMITPSMWLIQFGGSTAVLSSVPYSVVNYNLGVFIAAVFGGPLPAILTAVSVATNPFAIFISSVITLLCSFIRNRNFCSRYRYSVISALVLSLIINVLCFTESGTFELLSYVANTVLSVVLLCTYCHFRNKYKETFENWFPVRVAFKNAKVYRRISLKSELLIIINIIVIICSMLVSVQNDTVNQEKESEKLNARGIQIAGSITAPLSAKYTTEQLSNQNLLSENTELLREAMPRYISSMEIKTISLCRKDGDDYTVIDQCRVEATTDQNTGEIHFGFGDTGVYNEDYYSLFEDEEDLYDSKELYNLDNPIFSKEIKDNFYIMLRAKTDAFDSANNVAKNSFYVTISALIVINIFASWYIDKRIAAPVNRMTEAVSGFAYNEEKARIGMKEAFSSLGINTGNEIEALYTAYEKTMSDMTDYVDDIHRKSKQIAKFQHNIIVTMADIIESRDENTGGHIKRTAAYVEIIARRLQQDGLFTEILTDDYIRDMIVAAPLHDMGKIHVSDTILNKNGELTEEEFSIMKTHTTEGRKMLENATETLGVFSYLSVATDMANYHHEWWDGSGYPEGRDGDDIPLCARIMAVADVFDALISKRCYKEAMSVEEAYSIIRDETGTHFDPVISEAFFASTEEIEKTLSDFGG